MEAIFAVLVLMSPNGQAMVRVGDYLSMEECSVAAKNMRTFRAGREEQAAPSFAICVPGSPIPSEGK